MQSLSISVLGSKLNSQNHIIVVFIKSVGVIRKYIAMIEGSVKEVGIP